MTVSAPLNGLRAFEAAARHRSFTQAARELNVTQSAVSHQIRKLEEYLGVTLFLREGNELSLTHEAQELYPDIREAFLLIGRGVEGVRSDRLKRPFGLSVRSHFALKWLAPRLARFWALYPGFDMRLFHSNGPADFAGSQIDLAVEWLPREAEQPHMRLLVEGRLTPACSPDLLASNPVSGPEDLQAHCLLHETDQLSWQQWLNLAGVPGLQPLRNHYYDDTNVRQQAAMEGQGFALVCPSLAADDIRNNRLVCPLPVHLETYNYYLVSPPSGRLNQSARKFANWLLEEARGDRPSA